LLKVDINNNVVTQKKNLPSNRITSFSEIEYSTGEYEVYNLSANNLNWFG